MSSSSSASILSIIPSVLLLISLSKSVVSSSLIDTACSEAGFTNKSDLRSCIEMLGSDRKAASAKNFRDLSVAIVEAGIAHAAKTRAYLITKRGTDSSGAYEKCKDSYDMVVNGFTDVVRELEHDADGASYLVKVVASDDIRPCVAAVKSAKVRDERVLHANRDVVIYGISAFAAIEKIRAN
ncbi:hypothetical protein ABFS82_03G083100 [Erythranthe guttata]